MMTERAPRVEHRVTLRDVDAPIAQIGHRANRRRHPLRGARVNPKWAARAWMSPSVSAPGRGSRPRPPTSAATARSRRSSCPVSRISARSSELAIRASSRVTMVGLRPPFELPVQAHEVLEDEVGNLRRRAADAGARALDRADRPGLVRRAISSCGAACRRFGREQTRRPAPRGCREIVDQAEPRLPLAVLEQRQIRAPACRHARRARRASARATLAVVADAMTKNQRIDSCCTAMRKILQLLECEKYRTILWQLRNCKIHATFTIACEHHANANH